MHFRFIPLFIALFFVESAMAQSLTYLSNVEEEPGEQSWYRVSFFNNGKEPTRLYLQTDGYCIAYLNGRVVSNTAFWPVRDVNSLIPEDDTIRFKPQIEHVSYDITRLLREGTNILALWVAPFGLTNAKVAASVIRDYGYFWESLVDAESDWQCTKANNKTTIKGEDSDATAYIYGWKSSTRDYEKLWTRPARRLLITDIWRKENKKEILVGGTIEPIGMTETRADSTLIRNYYFSEEQTGLLRITLRQARKGQIIRINGMTYVASGEDDEQFFTRFNRVSTNKLSIETKCNDLIPDIWSIELLKLDERFRYGFW